MRIGARGGRVIASAAGVVLAVAGAIAVIVAARGQQSPPEPPRSAAIPLYVHPSPAPPTAGGSTRPAPSTPAASHRTPTAQGPVLPGSEPVTLRIPAIDVNSRIEPLGLNTDGTVQTPPLAQDSYAGWYRYSPTPGSLGPSVILGHVDSAAYGPAVFFRLGDLRQGDAVYVTRADATIAIFRIERVVEYAKNTFPTLEVYGNIDHAGLRLITCGGKFDFSTRNYEDNIVAYASLVSSRHR